MKKKKTGKKRYHASRRQLSTRAHPIRTPRARTTRERRRVESNGKLHTETVVKENTSSPSPHHRWSQSGQPGGAAMRPFPGDAMAQREDSGAARGGRGRRRRSEGFASSGAATGSGAPVVGSSTVGSSRKRDKPGRGRAMGRGGGRAVRVLAAGAVEAEVGAPELALPWLD
uniref:Uncharacterized protein n=1 Tax=Oryza punctata TaxID=4537 RepID=A0A0E0MHZ6_ORYPU